MSNGAGGSDEALPSPRSQTFCPYGSRDSRKLRVVLAKVSDGADRRNDDNHAGGDGLDEGQDRVGVILQVELALRLLPHALLLGQLLLPRLSQPQAARGLLLKR